MEEKISSSITYQGKILTALDMDRQFTIEYLPKSPVAFGVAVNEQVFCVESMFLLFLPGRNAE